MCDSVRFEYDSIRTANGVYLVNRLLAILSVQHQTITLFKIDKTNGSLSKVIEIGRTLFEDDDFYLNSIQSNPRTENVFLGLFCLTVKINRFSDFRLSKPPIKPFIFGT